MSEQAWKQALNEKSRIELLRRAAEVRRRFAESMVIREPAEIEDVFRQDQKAEDEIRLRDIN